MTISWLDYRPTLWVIPALLIGVGAGLFMCSSGHDDLSKGGAQTAQLCYYTGTVGEFGTDHELLIATVIGSDTYTGIYNWVPAEKDTARGFWHGQVTAISGGVQVDGLATMSGEGQIGTQQQIIRIIDGGAAIGRGDLIESNGIYRYADASGLDFSSNTLPLVDCASVPVEAL